MKKKKTYKPIHPAIYVGRTLDGRGLRYGMTGQAVRLDCGHYRFKSDDPTVRTITLSARDIYFNVSDFPSDENWLRQKAEDERTANRNEALVEFLSKGA